MATVPAILLLFGGSWVVGRTLSALKDAASGAESAGASAAETRLLIRLALHDLDRLLSHAESRLHATPASHVDAWLSGGRSFTPVVGLTSHEASCVAALWTGSIVPLAPPSDPGASPGVGGSPAAVPSPPSASLDVSATGSMLSRASGGSSERPRIHRRARLPMSPPRESPHDGTRDLGSSATRGAPQPETEDDEAFALVSLAARPTVLYREFQPAASEPAAAVPTAGTPKDHLLPSHDGRGEDPLHQHAVAPSRRVSQGPPSPPPSPPPYPGFSATQLGSLSLLLRRLTLLLAAHRQYLDRGEWTRLLADLEVSGVRKGDLEGV